MAGKSSSLKKLQRLPRQALFDSHHWVDYIELLCLFGLDKEISKADFLQHYQKRKDIGEAPNDENSEAEEELVGDNDEQPSTTAEKKDRAELMIDDWFRHLSYRAGAFGDFYPFYLSRDLDVLHLRRSMLLRHRFYLFFLFSSNLAYFGQHQPTLTKEFEVLSSEVLRSILPDYAEVHIFGAGHQTARYSGNLWTKIQKLAKDLKEKTLLSKNDFSPHNYGDKGLDVVGWVPIDDPTPNLLLVFGQCACSPEAWEQKQSSSAASAWSSTITFASRPDNMSFIPFCLRHPDGSWHKAQDIHETILIDRLRFVLLLNDKYRRLRPHFSSEAIVRMIDREAAIA
jgi:hypothetical protein